MNGTYNRWADIYESLEGRVSHETWEMGILVEARQLARPPTSILDIGAGTGIGGRLLQAEFPGCRLLNLDRSASMLSRGGIPPETQIVADMADFSLSSQFELVVCGFDAMNCLAPDRLSSCLACVAAVLEPGGHLIFDYSSRQMLKVDWDGLITERPVGTRRLIARHFYDAAHTRTQVELEYLEGSSQMWTETHFHYSVDPFTLHEMAEAVGLSVVKLRNIDSTRFTPGCITHIYVLQSHAADRSCS